MRKKFDDIFSRLAFVTSVTNERTDGHAATAKTTLTRCVARVKSKIVPFSCRSRHSRRRWGDAHPRFIVLDELLSWVVDKTSAMTCRYLCLVHFGSKWPPLLRFEPAQRSSDHDHSTTRPSASRNKNY